MPVNKPCLHGALSADGMVGSVCWTEEFVIDDEDVIGQPTCENGNYLPFIGMVSNAIAMRIEDFLKNGKKRGFHCFENGMIGI